MNPPPLPEPDIGFPWRINAKDGSVHSAAYTADQLRTYAEEYGRLCAEAERDRLQARVAELEAAVKPFAALAKHYPLKRKYGNRPNAGELFEVSSTGIGAASYSVEDLHAAYRAIHGEDA